MEIRNFQLPHHNSATLYEDIDRKQSVGDYIRRRLKTFSSHNVDLAALPVFFTAAFALLAATLLIHFAKSSADGQDWAVKTFLGSAVIGLYGTILLKLLDIAQKRLSVVDIFSSELVSAGRVFLSTDLVGETIALYALADAGFGPLLGKVSEVKRTENYFAILEKNSSDLGMLASNIIDDITSFYIFAKASRDTMARAALWKEEFYVDDLKKADIARIAYCLFLMAIHGRKAVEALIEETELRHYATSVYSGIELKCFLFLYAALNEGDWRHKRLSMRKDRYMAMIKQIDTALDSPQPAPALP